MSRQTRPEGAMMDRERALYLYKDALERADLETMERILRLAEDDPLLAEQIQEMEEHAALSSYPELGLQDDAELVRELLQRHVPSAETQAEEAPPPLTVGAVVGKLLAERKVPQGDHAASLALRDRPEVVPASLGRSEALRFGRSLGVRVSEGFWQLFRETALLLGIGQSQQAGFAAARRTAERAPSPIAAEPAAPGDHDAPAAPRAEGAPATEAGQKEET